MSLEFVVEDTRTSFWVEHMVGGGLGFGGRTMSEIWQAITYARSGEVEALVAGTQNPLWCYKELFDRMDEDSANALMYLITAEAARRSKGRGIERPDAFFHANYRGIHEWAKAKIGDQNLPLTFTLNALVGWDWSHYVLDKIVNNKGGFDDVIPEQYKHLFLPRANKVAVIPLMSYGKSEKDIEQALDDGYVIMKLKIGHETQYTKTERGSERDLDEMLKLDKERLKMMHDLCMDRTTDLTKSGQIEYYLDANGRYDEEHLKQLLDYARKIGAMERIQILEEPVKEMNLDWRKYPRIIAADECAHSPDDVRDQIQRGVSYIALKPAAKTVSMTLSMLAVIDEYNKTVNTEEDKVYPFVADLTVIPPLIQLNMAFAARLPILPFMNVPIFETNFHQHYLNMERLLRDQISPRAKWARHHNGMYDLSTESYKKTEGVIFAPFPVYQKDAGKLIKLEKRR